ncbi:MAG TPA: inorganic diphosphatase [Phenylobacterium sp.]|uniref:inorganic diphosphatase n=1 Tax=Phenylobacterium sp. TaxID=1871053 RepID=UPI002B499FB9|nr:inorganic diphosphatase [Phenylobacterium sp.]HKR89643.1 inorganic diphosphatase [Phenylobacterium sp.]
MTKLTKLSHELDAKTGVCLAIIETPKGRRSKFDYDVDLKAFRLKKLLPEGLSFPLDFGFIPSTLCDDGDPLDVMVLADEPLSVGVILDVRLIGVINAEEKEKGKTERNDRILAVAAISRLYEAVRTPDDLPKDFVDNLSSFWIQKGRLEGKEFTTLGVDGPAAAIDRVKSATRTAKKQAA